MVSNTKFNFKLGDDVYLRPKSSKELGLSGRIVDIYDAANSKGTASEKPATGHSKRRRLAEDVRVCIQPHCFFDSKESKLVPENPCSTVKQNVRPSRLFPVYDIRNAHGSNPRGSLVVITPDTTNFRQLAIAHLRPRDHVLEVGCSTGETTALLIRRLLLLHLKRCSHSNGGTPGQVIAFDTGADMIEKARDRLRSEFSRMVSKGCDGKEVSSRPPMVHYHKVNALLDPKGARSQAGQPDMVLIDIGGNREKKGVADMLHWVQSAFQKDPPRLIIVKSLELTTDLAKFVGSKVNGTELKADQTIAADGMFVTPIGIISNAQKWFSSLLLSSEKANVDRVEPRKSVPAYSHPMKAPLVLSPTDNVTPICRFHNYHPDGCQRYRSGSHACPYDHEHCHWCGKTGHVALNCDARDP